MGERAFVFKVKGKLSKDKLDDLRKYFLAEEVKINTWSKYRVHLSEELRP